MILTFLFVERNSVTVAVKLKKMCVNVNKGHGYVVVYRSKKRHVYCKYKDEIRCDGTVVLYFLPLSLLIGKMKNQSRLKPFNNIAPAIRTSLSWICLWLTMWRDSGTVKAHVNIVIYVLLVIMQKIIISEYDIIQRIFKWCESYMYLIVLIPK